MKITNYNHQRAFSSFTSAFKILLSLKISIQDISNKFSSNPASFYNIPDRGKVEKGAFADLVVIKKK